jgi:hypothetical protein
MGLRTAQAWQERVKKKNQRRDEEKKKRTCMSKISRGF